MTQQKTESSPSFHLSYDEQNRVVLRRQGRDDASDVRIRRAFPWTEPDRYVSIRSAEGGNPADRGPRGARR